MAGAGDQVPGHKRKALVLGATGLVGSELVKQLLADDDYQQVVTFGRRAMPPLGELEPRLMEKHTHHRVDFERPDAWESLVQGDVLFSALGTTLKAAGSKERQFRVDHDYQLSFAQAAKKSGVPTYVLVSSTGASERSRVFYSRMKGQLERAALGLRFSTACILRPGILDGDRLEKRSGERVALALLRHLPPLSSLSKARPVHVRIVARACRTAARENPEGVHIWEARDIFERGA